MLRIHAIAAAALAATSSIAIAQTTPAAAPTAMPQTMDHSQHNMTGATATTQTATTTPATSTSTNTIVETAVATPSLSTLVTAVQAADLADTLSGPGPFTVFAPENEAFTRLAPGTLDTLLKPENKATLAKVLTYHVVPGKVTLEQLKAQIAAGNGTATLTTVEGSPLTVAEEGAAIVLTDTSGNKSYVAKPDLEQSNGVVHVVNGVVVPKLT
ncbi:fasciclin domain-containing protein [Sphingomonas baiyangensis]|uniref:Fasciclin domain-containing protein n=2 Tax=Sphingomonas baiyangensis TaxID=2572576 RepID=A0A4U1L1C4_9SPHN|nr:fasciclin domain-containing protein [Sphingomonas baiyangensis]